MHGFELVYRKILPAYCGLIEPLPGRRSAKIPLQKTANKIRLVVPTNKSKQSITRFHLCSPKTEVFLRVMEAQLWQGLEAAALAFRVRFRALIDISRRKTIFRHATNDFKQLCLRYMY
jgi:hypothetical protein